MLQRVVITRGTCLGGVGNDAYPGQLLELPAAQAAALVAAGRAAPAPAQAPAAAPPAASPADPIAKPRRSSRPAGPAA